MVESSSATLLKGTEVHIWTADLDVDAEALSILEGTLDRAELARAARFHFQIHRNRFIVGRAMLRGLLAEYAGLSPAQVEFAYGPAGKPVLASMPASPIHFNLAHCENIAVAAFTREGVIGVDVERVRLLEDAEELVRRFFSPRESAAFTRLAPEQKPAAFFNLWTRKEAWLKACGEGIAHSLHLVEVTFLPGEPAHLLRLPEHFGKSEAWKLRAFEAAPGFVAAAALGPKSQEPTFRTWSAGFHSQSEMYESKRC